MERKGQTVEVLEGHAPPLDMSPAVTGRMLCLGATFLNVNIIRNYVRLPFLKGLLLAARALVLIGQIVFGFETQTVINETTVNEFGPRWFLHLFFPADRESTGSCCLFVVILPGMRQLVAWSEKDGIFDLNFIVFDSLPLALGQNAWHQQFKGAEIYIGPGYQCRIALLQRRNSMAEGKQKK